MTLIEQPWARVKNPVPLILDRDRLKNLSLLELAELVRSNLLPPEGRNFDWEQMWTSLRVDQELNDDVWDILQEFEDSIDDALESGELDEAQAKRARKFRLSVRNAQDRIDDKKGTGPLSWAGRSGVFPEKAARVLYQAAVAIYDHRVAAWDKPGGPDEADKELYRALKKMRLDPGDYPDFDPDRDYLAD